MSFISIIKTMGNYIGTETKTSINIDMINQLNNYNKHELIEYIKTLKPKCINITNDSHDKIKTIELLNTKLLPMSIELYHRLLSILSERNVNLNKQLINPKNKLVRKYYYIKPKFTTDDIIKANTPIDKNIIPLDETMIKIIQPIVSMKNCEITLEEFNESFGNDLSKKDMIGISKKILRDMSTYLKIRFINAYNDLLSGSNRNFSDVIVDGTKTYTDVSLIAKGSFVYKIAKAGPLDDINSFRQILAIPNIINQFHRILNIRLSNYMLCNKYIDINIQKGGITGQKFSIFEQFFKVKNVLLDANKNNKSCTILFLDITNAFGNIKLDNLYTILELYGVDKSFINYLSYFYNNLEYYFDTNGITTKPIKWSDGLIQGCSLSPLLFIIAMNYILTHIDKKYKDEHGYCFDGDFSTKILLTAYVDDICIICKDNASAQIVFDEFEKALNMLGLPISISKSAVMTINNNDQSQRINELFKQVDIYRYLGEDLTIDGSSTKSCSDFLKSMTKKMYILDNKKCTNEDKILIYEKMILPWIQRKTILLYDITMSNRMKIVVIIKTFMEKWGLDVEKWSNENPIGLFFNIFKIVRSSQDYIIKELGIKCEDTIHDLEKNIDVANYIIKDSNIDFSYDQIDDDYRLDEELEHLYNLVDKL